MSYLSKTTFDELAVLTDELEIGEQVIFSTEDPDVLHKYQIEPCKYNVIYKTRLLYESDYVILIGLINGNCTIAKDINIISDGKTDDEDIRVEGIKSFIEEYYEKHMLKNENNNIYLILD